MLSTPPPRWPRLCWRALLMALFCIAMPVSPVDAQMPGGKRLALVIGNAGYPGDAANPRSRQWWRLASPKSDADALAKRLRQLGFEVLDRYDLTAVQMHTAVKDLAQRAATANAEAVLVFYAGHGASVERRNYLIPVDAGPLEAGLDSVLDRGVFIDHWLAPLAHLKAAKIVLLDACRGLPLSYKGQGNDGALVEPEVPGGMVIGFSAAPGKLAVDGGAYVRGLLKGLAAAEPNLLNVLVAAADEVKVELGGDLQRPNSWGDDRTKRDFWFAAPRRLEPPVDPRVADLQAQLAIAKEQLKQRPDAAPVMARATGETNSYPGGPKLTVLPTGSYLRGSEDEKDRDSDEGPVREVKISYTLAMGTTEVTRGQFGQFVADAGYKTDAERGDGCYSWGGSEWKKDAKFNWRSLGFAQTDDHPVACVSWADAQQYIAWLNKKAGLAAKAKDRYRLPSEAEFEYAARGVTQPGQQRSGQQHQRFYWGDDLDYSKICRYANGADLTAKKQFNWSPTSNCEDGHVYTAPVGSFEANAFKLKDMLGNVWEWTQDCYEGDYKQAPTDGSAWEPAAQAEGCRRVLRGGGWDNNPRNLRAAVRVHLAPDNRSIVSGFRVARTLFTP